MPQVSVLAAGLLLSYRAVLKVGSRGAPPSPLWQCRAGQTYGSGARPELDRACQKFRAAGSIPAASKQHPTSWRQQGATRLYSHRVLAGQLEHPGILGHLAQEALTDFSGGEVLGQQLEAFEGPAQR